VIKSRIMRWDRDRITWRMGRGEVHTGFWWENMGDKRVWKTYAYVGNEY